MPTNFPSGVDSFAAVAGTDDTNQPIGSRTHSQFHTDTGDAIVAIQNNLKNVVDPAIQDFKDRVAYLEANTGGA